MSKRAPYLIIPYNSIMTLHLNQGSYFYSEFFRNVFDDTDAKVDLDISSRDDTWRLCWNLSAFREMCEFLQMKLPSDTPENQLNLLNQFQALVQTVDHIRNIHNSKQWDLCKIGVDMDREVIHFDKFLEDIERIKRAYNPQNETFV
jgi:hypothetical protein